MTFGKRSSALVAISIVARLLFLSTDATAADQRGKYSWDNNRSQQPVVALKNKIITIDVFIDPALRRHPGLNDNLMTEAKAYRSRWAKEADEILKEDPKFFENGRKWTVERLYSVRSQIGRYLSIERSDSTYSGGAHGNLDIDTILWDLISKKRVSVRRLFIETADDGPTMTALARLARLAIAAAKMERESGNAGTMSPEEFLKQDSMIEKGVAPALRGIGAISLAPSTVSGKSAGLTFHYPPYAVDVYAAGPHTAFVQWQRFAKYLSPEGLALFGGERPEKDKDDY